MKGSGIGSEGEVNAKAVKIYLRNYGDLLTIGAPREDRVKLIQKLDTYNNRNTVDAVLEAIERIYGTRRATYRTLRVDVRAVIHNGPKYADEGIVEVLKEFPDDRRRILAAFKNPTAMVGEEGASAESWLPAVVQEIEDAGEAYVLKADRPSSPLFPVRRVSIAPPKRKEVSGRPTKMIEDIELYGGDVDENKEALLRKLAKGRATRNMEARMKAVERGRSKKDIDLHIRQLARNYGVKTSEKTGEKNGRPVYKRKPLSDVVTKLAGLIGDKGTIDDKVGAAMLKALLTEYGQATLRAETNREKRGNSGWIVFLKKHYEEYPRKPKEKLEDYMRKVSIKWRSSRAFLQSKTYRRAEKIYLDGQKLGGGVDLRRAREI